MNKKAFVSLLAGCGLLAVASVAGARTLGGFAGRGISWSDNSCFYEAWGSTTNNCTGSGRYWRTFTPIDNSGNRSVTVNAYGASSSNNVGCAAFGLSEDDTTYWGGTYVYLPSFGSNQRINVGSAYVPGYGFLFVDCVVNYGGRINSIQWSP